MIFNLFFLFFNSEKDNPFRPEGELAKEAEEFVQKLKEKQEQDINQILNATVSSTTPLPSPNATLKLQDNAEQSTAAPSVIDNASQPVSPSSKHEDSTSNNKPESAAPQQQQQTQSTPVNNESSTKTQQSPSSKKEKEAANGGQKKKTKPKCGCLIS